MPLLTKLLSLLPSLVGAVREILSTPDSRVREESSRAAEETRHISDLSRDEWRKLVARSKRS